MFANHKCAHAQGRSPHRQVARARGSCSTFSQHITSGCISSSSGGNHCSRTLSHLHASTNQVCCTRSSRGRCGGGGGGVMVVMLDIIFDCVCSCRSHMAWLASLTRPHGFVGFLGIRHTPTPPCWLSWHLPHSHTILLASVASPHFLLFYSPRTTLLASLSPLHDCVGFLVIFHTTLMASLSPSTRLCWLLKQLLTPTLFCWLFGIILPTTVFASLAFPQHTTCLAALAPPHDFVGFFGRHCTLAHDGLDVGESCVLQFNIKWKGSVIAHECRSPCREILF